MTSDVVAARLREHAPADAMEQEHALAEIMQHYVLASLALRDVARSTRVSSLVAGALPPAHRRAAGGAEAITVFARRSCGLPNQPALSQNLFFPASKPARHPSIWH